MFPQARPGPNVSWMLSHLLQTEKVGDVFDAAKADPVLAGALIVAGLATLVVFLWGLTRQLFKAALFAGLASAGIWFWYFKVK